MASIQGIYIALFGRPADPAGLAFWTEATKGGQDLSALTAMTQTPEYLNRFAGKTPEEIVTTIYQSLFGRAPDAGGLEFFVNALENGSLDTIAIQILDGAQGSDAVIIDNKEAAADLFTASLDTPEEIAAYSGENAILNAQNLLSEVTEDPSSIPTTQDIDAAIQTLDQPPEEQNEEEETPPVGGGGGGGPTTTFTVLVDGNDQVTFGGSATGDITVVDGKFVRAGIAVEVPSDIASIVLGAGDKLVANAGFLDGLAISGGTVEVLTPNVLETTENFTNAISLEDSSTAVDGKWYIDRYAPDGFSVANNELVQTISAADGESGRGPQSAAFYNTQGRAYDLRDGTTEASITLAIDTDWSTLGDNARVAGFWGVGRDAAGAVSFYPIVEYARVDGDGVLKFWTASGFSATTLPVAESATSIDIGFRLNQDGTFTYTVDGVDVLTTPAPGTVEIGSVILQGHNDADGQDYSITWDDLTTSSNVAYDPSIDLSGITSDLVLPEGLNVVRGIQVDDTSGSSQTASAGTLADGSNIITEARSGSIDSTAAGLLLDTDSSSGRLRLNVVFDADDQVRLGEVNDLGFVFTQLAIDAGSSSTYSPAFRLMIDADGDLSTTVDRGELVFEYAYQNNGPIPVGTQVVADLTEWNAWQRSNNANRDVYPDIVEFDDWSDAGGYTPNGGVTFNANSVVLGYSIGLGSGAGSGTAVVGSARVGDVIYDFA